MQIQIPVVNVDSCIAGGFANSMLLRQRSSLPTDEQTPSQEVKPPVQHKKKVKVVAQQNPELRADLVSRAAAVRDITGAAIDRGMALRELLKGGVLAGQPVFFQSRHGEILLTGENAVQR